MQISGSSRTKGRSYLDGQCLIAMPDMRDERFARTVVYLCAHSDEGAMGLVINRAAPDIRFAELMVQLKIIEDEHSIRLDRRQHPVSVLRGGPVEPARGFVLHSADYYAGSSTMPIDSGVCMTHTVDVLRALAVGEGPRDAVLALGYAGWSAGQLESEIKANGWLHCQADPDLLFDPVADTKYPRALAKLGIEPGLLSATAGRA
jgi:putative transcriptional regulator